MVARGPLLLAAAAALPAARGQASCPQAPTIVADGAASRWIELAPAPASVVCPAGGWSSAAEVGDSCYWFSAVPRTFDAAEADCAARGGTLPRIIDDATNDWLVARMQGHSRWIGLRHSGRGGELAWVDGGRSALDTVTPATPAAAGSCALLCAGAAVRGEEGCLRQGAWWMTGCAAEQRYVCQRPSGAVRAHTTWTSSSGQTLLAADDGWVDISLPFDFEFFGETFAAGDLVRASTNGYLTFGWRSSHHMWGSTSPIPNSETPNSMIAVYWTDLYPYGADRNGAGLLSRGDQERLVIEWNRIPYWLQDRSDYCGGGSGNAEVCGRTATFAAILERNGTVVLAYSDCDPLPHTTDSDLPEHAELSIGYENLDGTFGQQIRYARDDEGRTIGYQGAMTQVHVTIPPICHENLPACSARVSNATAECQIESAGVSGGSGWVEYFSSSKRGPWHLGPVCALAMSMVVSCWRLLRVVTRGHMWRGHFISLSSDVTAIQAMLIAAQAGGGARRTPSLSRAELENLARISPAQLLEPVASPRDTQVRLPESVALPEAQPETQPEKLTGGGSDGASGGDPGSALTETVSRNFGNDTCAICMCSLMEVETEVLDGDDAEDPSAAMSLIQLNCTHVFHAECVGPWLQRHRECPICKRDAVFGDGDIEALTTEGTDGTDAPRPAGGGGDGADGAQPQTATERRTAARRAVGNLGAYRACDRSCFVVSLASIVGLFLSTVSEVEHIEYCEDDGRTGEHRLSLRCGFFVAVALVSFIMAAVAMAALHTPVRGRCLWDGFSGWVLFSFCIISVCSSWYDKIGTLGVSQPDGSALTAEELVERQSAEVASILLRFGAGVIAVVQLATARERELSIRWYLEVRAAILEATAGQGDGQAGDGAP